MLSENAFCLFIAAELIAWYSKHTVYDTHTLPSTRTFAVNGEQRNSVETFYKQKIIMSLTRSIRRHQEKRFKFHYYTLHKKFVVPIFRAILILINLKSKTSQIFKQNHNKCA